MVVNEPMLQGGVEYVLKKPLKGKALEEAVNNLCDKLDVEKFTQRCSTHIHLDVRDMNLTQIMNLVTVYVCFERIILSLVQEERVGNLFCLPVYDSLAVEDILIEVAKGTKDIYKLPLEGWKYCSINLASIGRLGSLEFRSLHGTKDPDEILRWIGVHQKLYAYAMTEGLTPDQIIMNTSVKGGATFFKEVMGEMSEHFEGLDLNNLVELGMRNAQYFAFSGEWNEW
jgi:hypothetical protein